MGVKAKSVKQITSLRPRRLPHTPPARLNATVTGARFTTSEKMAARPVSCWPHAEPRAAGSGECPWLGALRKRPETDVRHVRR